MLNDPAARQVPRKLPIFAALAQGFFCLVIGLWPVVDFPSFLAVTGQKLQPWPLGLAGLLLASIGASMIISAIRRDIAFEVYTIGLMTALSLAATDIFFVIERSIPFIYLLDAVAELLFVTLWVFAIRDLRRSRRLPAQPAPPDAGFITESEGKDATGSAGKA
jgi:hypothetical protein